MASNNRMVLSQETINNPKNPFAGYARRVTNPNLNSETLKIKEFKVTNTGKTTKK